MPRIVLKDLQSGKTHTAHEVEATIGRDPASAIVIDGENSKVVSGRHALIYYVDDAFQYALYAPDPDRRWVLEPYRASESDLAYETCEVRTLECTRSEIGVHLDRCPDYRIRHERIAMRL